METLRLGKMKCLPRLLARESGSFVWELDECDVVLEGGSCAAVARVLHEVVREEDLAPGLVPVQVVHTHVSVRAVGAARTEVFTLVVKIEPLILCMTKYITGNRRKYGNLP